MEHRINPELPAGSYRIICTKCGDVKEFGYGDFTKANLASMKHSPVCDKCGGKVILETNPEEVKNKYDKDHPYPSE